MQVETRLMEEYNHLECTQDDWIRPRLGLTVELFCEDGSWMQFSQSDKESIAKIVKQLNTPLLFTQPFLTLASERSVTTMPCRIIDLVMARMTNAPQLFLPPGWLDIVEISPETFYQEGTLKKAGKPNHEDLESKAKEGIFHAVIHTSGNSKIILRLRAANESAIEKQSQSLAVFFSLPSFPFRLETGGAGFINPSKISHLTIYPAIEGVNEAALPADLQQCVRT